MSRRWLIGGALALAACASPPSSAPVVDRTARAAAPKPPGTMVNAVTSPEATERRNASGERITRVARASSAPARLPS